MPNKISLRTTTKKKTIQLRSKIYKAKKVGVRKTRKPIAFCPGQSSKYLKPWIIPRAELIRKSIEAKRTKKLVEEYGEVAAKWHLARVVLNQEIPDAPAGTFQTGHFVTFQGANTVDVIYVDTKVTPDVYILEAKGGTAALSVGGRKGKYSPNKGKKLSQGTWAYLYDVATAMTQTTNPAKIAAGNAILKAYNDNNGKLHYIGVSAKIPVGSASAPSPDELFNQTR